MSYNGHWTKPLARQLGGRGAWQASARCGLLPKLITMFAIPVVSMRG